MALAVAVIRAKRHRRLFANVVAVLETIRLTGTRAGPEACYAIIGAGAEDVPERMILHAPDGVLVRPGKTRGGLKDGIGGVCVAAWDLIDEVVVHRAVGPAGGDDAGVGGVPGERADVFFVAAEDGEVFHRPQVEDAACLVTRTGGEEVATGGLEDGFRDSVFMAVEGGEATGGTRVPEFNEVVLGAGNNEAFGGVPVDGFDVPAVSSEGALFHTFVEVPELEGAVVGGGDEFGVRGRETGGSEGG